MIAGCINTALDFLILNVMTLALGLPPLVGNTVSVTFGICISYALQHFFVFRYEYRISWRKFLQFFVITGFSSLVIQNTVIFLFELLFNTKFGNSLLFLPTAAGRHVLALNFAKLCAVIIGLFWNYTMYRLVVFRKPKTAVAESVTTEEQPE